MHKTKKIRFYGGKSEKCLTDWRPICVSMYVIFPGYNLNPQALCVLVTCCKWLLKRPWDSTCGEQSSIIILQYTLLIHVLRTKIIYSDIIHLSTIPFSYNPQYYLYLIVIYGLLVLTGQPWQRYSFKHDTFDSYLLVFP